MALFIQKNPSDVLLWDMGDAASKTALVRLDDKRIELVAWRQHEHTRASKNMKEVIRDWDFSRNIFVWCQVPPSMSKVRVIQEERMRTQRSSVISPLEERSILEGMRATSRMVLAEEWQAQGILAKDIVLLSCEVLNINIDGYAVPRIRGFHGSRVQATLLAVGMPSAYRDQFEDFFRRGMIKGYQLIHEAQLLRSFARGVAPEGIYGDIGERATQIFVIQDGILSSMTEYPCGGRDFTQAIEQKLHVSDREARELKEQYSRMSLEGERSEGIRELIHGLMVSQARIWAEGVAHILKTRVPRAFHLYGGGSNVPEITEIFEQGSLLHPKDVFPQISFPHDPLWTPLALLSRFVYESKTY